MPGATRTPTSRTGANMVVDTTTCSHTIRYLDAFLSAKGQFSLQHF